MVGGEGEAYLGIGFEAAGGGEEYDVGGFEGVFCWEEDAAVVVSSFEVCSVCSTDGEVPV